MPRAPTNLWQAQHKWTVQRPNFAPASLTCSHSIRQMPPKTPCGVERFVPRNDPLALAPSDALVSQPSSKKASTSIMKRETGNDIPSSHVEAATASRSSRLRKPSTLRFGDPRVQALSTWLASPIA